MILNLYPRPTKLERKRACLEAWQLFLGRSQ
jgi:hypothetical protein